MTDLANKFAMYDDIVEHQCKTCKGYKPRKKSNCGIYKELLVRHSKLVMQKESLLIENGKCKGYTPNEQNK